MKCKSEWNAVSVSFSAVCSADMVYVVTTPIFPKNQRQSPSFSIIVAILFSAGCR